MMFNRPSKEITDFIIECGTNIKSREELASIIEKKIKEELLLKNTIKSEYSGYVELETHYFSGGRWDIVARTLIELEKMVKKDADLLKHIFDFEVFITNTKEYTRFNYVIKGIVK